MHDHLNETLPHIIVTGGAAGIGAEISKCLLESGYSVVAISPRASSKQFKHKNLLKIDCDVSNFSDTLSKFRELEATGVHVTGLVNNAGLSRWKSVPNFDQAFLDEMMRANVYTTICATKSALECFPDLRTVTNISSMAGKRGTTNNSAYVASKFAVEGLTRAWCAEFGPRNIRVNSICPVLIKSPGLLNEISGAEGPVQGQGVDEFLDEFIQKQSPLGKLPSGRDVGNLVKFLLSEDADSISGQSINVDCGVLPG